MNNSDELSSQVASCIKAKTYLLFPSSYILTTLERSLTYLNHLGMSPIFFLAWCVPWSFLDAFSASRGHLCTWWDAWQRSDHRSWVLTKNWCHGWAMVKPEPMWVSNFNQSQWQSDNSGFKKTSAWNFQHPTDLFSSPRLVTFFIIFERQESQANIAELHCILHCDRITATIFQTGMVCQGLNVACYCDLDAHRSLWHFEDLGKSQLECNLKPVLFRLAWDHAMNFKIWRYWCWC